MTFKVLILGEPGTGKTSLRNQFFFGSFTLSYTSTIGANFLTKSIHVPSATTVSLCVWDTAGQERFNALSPTYFRGTDCCVLVYDLTRPATLNAIKAHFDGVKRVCGHVGVVVVVGNKQDAVLPNAQHEETVRTWVVDEIGEDVGVLRCSAKSGNGVAELFELVAMRCTERRKRQQLLEEFEMDESEVVRGTVNLRRRGSLGKHTNGCAC